MCNKSNHSSNTLNRMLSRWFSVLLLLSVSQSELFSWFMKEVLQQNQVHVQLFNHVWPEFFNFSCDPSHSTCGFCRPSGKKSDYVVPVITLCLKMVPMTNAARHTAAVNCYFSFREHSDICFLLVMIHLKMCSFSVI